MRLKTLSACVALIGAGAFSGVASAAPITGQLSLVGLSITNPQVSVRVCTTDPCTLGTWTGLDFAPAFMNFFAATGVAATVAGGGSGMATMQDPVSFSTPSTLFSMGNLRFDWTTVTLAQNGPLWGASFEGTLNDATGTYSPTAYRFEFSTQDSGTSWSGQIPLPGTLALIGMGLLGAGLVRARRRA